MEDIKTQKAYEAGYREATAQMVDDGLRRLGYKGGKFENYNWVEEREAIISSLRRICADFGDNSWGDDLHLGDVIDKHLAPYLKRIEDNEGSN